MPDRSGFEDKAMALGLIAVGAALPIYEVVSERLREFGRTPSGKVLGFSIRTTYKAGSFAARLLDRNEDERSESETKRKPARKRKAAA